MALFIPETKLCTFLPLCAVSSVYSYTDAFEDSDNYVDDHNDDEGEEDTQSALAFDNVVLLV